MKRLYVMKLMVGLVMGAAVWSAHAADLPYVNFENHPIHALDLSPDRSLLAVAHTADQRVQLFDVSSGTPVSIGHVVVGVDPVSVRFRNNGELWAVNHISDSVSVIDVATRKIKTTLATADEPFDVVFTAGRAFVSCSQANQIAVFDLTDLTAAPRSIKIAAEDPRALAVSPDGNTVYAAIFESGNATTALPGNFIRSDTRLPNTVSDVRGPYGGVNPPPNSGNSFVPAINPAAPPPAVSLIVRRDSSRRWLDDNGRDWTRLVSGDLSGASGRVPGWDVVDRDVAVIDANSLSVRYITGLMNIAMAISVKPNTGEISVIGTDASNEIRFEPNVKGRFVKVQLARINGAEKTISDLNPHLNYQTQIVPQSERDKSIGDPRAIVWRADGTLGWVAAMGSNNVIVIDAAGRRVGAPIRTGLGPIALALDEGRNRLYAWNHFEASLSVINTTSAAEVVRVALFNPLPASIKAGRAFLYDTQRTSGLGQASCASCHVDARIDKLAWDLGDPSQPPALFDQNCATSLVTACQNYHAMKGPMTTQTMQDIIGHEPLHWRGDRRGIESFNPAFVGLLGDDVQLTPTEMSAFKNYLSTIVFPPNPFRNTDNSLPDALNLNDQRTSGRFALPGLPLGIGNANRGLQLYASGFLDGQIRCAACHTLPTGMAVNGSVRATQLNLAIGGGSLPLGPMGENHLGIVSTDGFNNISIKVPQLRNMYEKVGMEFTSTESLSGFGFAHDGSVDSMADFLSASVFTPTSDQDVADLVALQMAFAGSDFALPNPTLSAPAPLSKDSHAAVGKQVNVTSTTLPTLASELLTLARAAKIDLIVSAGGHGYVFDSVSERFLTDDGTAALTQATLLSVASAQNPQTWTAVSQGLGKRLGIDRDGDGVTNFVEIKQGSDPTDAASTQVRPIAGLWFNPARSGHGFDVQFGAGQMFATWYTYQDDGTPTWYQAVAPVATNWTAPLTRYVWNQATQRAVGSVVGQLSLTFSDAQTGRVDWQLGTRRGSEPLIPANGGASAPIVERTGAWYDPLQPGWGLSIYTQGDFHVSIAYFYDGANQPRWLIGQASNTTSVTLPMQSARGFCPDCTAQAVTFTPGGEVRINFTGTQNASASTDIFDAGSPSAHWLRGPVLITTISAPVLHPERF
jgi:YVTN family beta-propeller protein